MLLTTLIEVIQNMVRDGGRWTLCLGLAGTVILAGFTLVLAVNDDHKLLLTMAAFGAGLYVGAVAGFKLDRKDRTD